MNCIDMLRPLARWDTPGWGEIQVTATITHSIPGPYGFIQHQAGYVTYWTRSDLFRAIRNAADLPKGTSHIVVDADTRLAYQASGYSPSRGMFCDLLTHEQLETCFVETK